MVPEVFRSAPPLEIPVPEIVIGSAMVMPPDTDTAAPLVSDVFPLVAPNDAEFDTATTPALTVVAPE